jgi:Reverse transcriptase (RNA-dependent DNA polymerase)
MALTPWKLTESKIKKYKHFDSVMSIRQAEELANDPALVQKHTFYPFITYDKRWTQYADKGKKGEVKSRPIAYAARADAYIYARYRSLLSEYYEQRLNVFGLDKNVLAYRKIIDPKTGAGKCNINYANEVFEKIRSFETSCTIALDISKYFQSIDHQLLYERWADTIGKIKLPSDHLTVFRNITNYSEVEKMKVYERLGYYGKFTTPSGKTHNGYLRPQLKVPTQLCNGSTFRNKIAGGNGRSSIVIRNNKSYGIPQGSPISDVLANIYLLEFDKLVRDHVEKLGGIYTRYSDDILVVVPIATEQAQVTEEWIRGEISKFGSALKIKQEKSTVLEFYPEGNQHSFKIIYDGKSKAEMGKRKTAELQSRGIDPILKESVEEINKEIEKGRSGLNGLEYLGFRFDGKKVFLRDSTFSNLRRKIKIRTRIEARKFVAERPTLDIAQLKKNVQGPQGLPLRIIR